MKKFLYILPALLLMASPALWAQKSGKSYVIGFYNLENLFDTYHDEGHNDYEYRTAATPGRRPSMPRNSRTWPRSLQK